MSKDKPGLTIAYEGPDEGGWIVASVVEVPGAMSQGRTREEAYENLIDALRLVLSPDDGELRRRLLQREMPGLTQELVDELRQPRTQP